MSDSFEASSPELKVMHLCISSTTGQLNFILFWYRNSVTHSNVRWNTSAQSYYADHSEDDIFLSNSTIHLYQQHSSCFVALSVELWKICKRRILDTIFSRYRVRMSGWTLSPSCIELVIHRFHRAAVREMMGMVTLLSGSLWMRLAEASEQRRDRAGRKRPCSQ